MLLLATPCYYLLQYVLLPTPGAFLRGYLRGGARGGLVGPVRRGARALLQGASSAVTAPYMQARLPQSLPRPFERRDRATVRWLYSTAPHTTYCSYSNDPTC